MRAFVWLWALGCHAAAAPGGRLDPGPTAPLPVEAEADTLSRVQVALPYVPPAEAAPVALPRPVILDKLLPFPEARVALTLAYRTAHQGEAQPAITIDPRVIVLHWTGGGSMEGAWATFAPTELSGRADVGRGGSLNVSAHFLVDRDGTIYRLMPETWMARHCIGLNHVAIGIENVGDGAANPLTPAQVAANVALVRDLAGRYSITHLIGHHEYRAMERHPYFVEVDPNYRTGKVDPGDAFMRAVRAGVADIGLAGPPP